MPVATTGRVRYTCSDRCRQRLRRQSYDTWIDPKNARKLINKAERELRAIEKIRGSLAVPVRKGSTLTVRDRLRIQLVRYYRGDKSCEVQYCHVCYRPYPNDRYRKYPVCSKRCHRHYVENQRAVAEGIQKYAGQYNRAVDVRIRLGIPVATCKHCGIPFPPYNLQKKYCSEKCKDAAYWLRRPRRKCQACGEWYRGNAKVCSMRCYGVLQYRIKPHCARCQRTVQPGSEVWPDSDTRLPRKYTWQTRLPAIAGEKQIVFCSGRCRDQLGWSGVRKGCDYCGKGFYPSARANQQKQRFCGKECTIGFHNRERHALERAARPPKVCRHCGATVPAERSWGHNCYCSDECKRLAGRLRLEAKRKVYVMPDGLLRRDMELVAGD